MPLEHALAHATGLRDALTREVDRARTQRKLLLTLDSDALFAAAASREEFNLDAEQKKLELGAALAAAKGAFSLREVTVAEICRAAPKEGAQLAALLSEMRFLAKALHELDELNRALSRRMLSFLNQYATSVAPSATAYGPRRASEPQLPTGSVSERV